jgi:argininosuccinate synthase
MDANLLHISYEGGVLEDPWEAPPAEGMFRMTVDPEGARTPAMGHRHLRARARRWRSTARSSDRSSCSPGQRIAGRHGVGRVDIVENRFVGMKSRGVYETPAAPSSTTPTGRSSRSPSTAKWHHLRDELVPRYAEMVYNGFWFSPEREALQAFMDDIQKRVNGEARLKLYKGAAPSRAAAPPPRPLRPGHRHLRGGRRLRPGRRRRTPAAGFMKPPQRVRPVYAPSPASDAQPVFAYPGMLVRPLLRRAFGWR